MRKLEEDEKYMTSKLGDLRKLQNTFIYIGHLDQSFIDDDFICLPELDELRAK